MRIKFYCELIVVAASLALNGPAYGEGHHHCQRNAAVEQFAAELTEFRSLRSCYPDDNFNTLSLFAVSENGRIIAVNDDAERAVRIYDRSENILAAETLIQDRYSHLEVTSLSISPDGAYIAIGLGPRLFGPSNVLLFFNMESNRYIRELNFDGLISSPAFSSDARLVMLLGSEGVSLLTSEPTIDTVQTANRRNYFWGGTFVEYDVLTDLFAFPELLDQNQGTPTILFFPTRIITDGYSYWINVYRAQGACSLPDFSSFQTAPSGTRSFQLLFEPAVGHALNCSLRGRISSEPRVFAVAGSRAVTFSRNQYLLDDEPVFPITRIEQMIRQMRAEFQGISRSTALVGPEFTERLIFYHAYSNSNEHLFFVCDFDQNCRMERYSIHANESEGLDNVSD